MATMQYEVGLRQPDVWVEFYRPLEQEEGFAWFVPCGRTARIGIGIRRTNARFLKPYLSRFVDRFVADGRIYEGILGCTGGLLPVNGTFKSARTDGILLAGDAGGLAAPFSGTGIATAVVSGEVAGSLIGAAVGAAAPKMLVDYDFEVRARVPAGTPPGLSSLEHLAEQVARVSQWQG